jgi:hypothetical protein
MHIFFPRVRHGIFSAQSRVSVPSSIFKIVLDYIMYYLLYSLDLSGHSQSMMYGHNSLVYGSNVAVPAMTQDDVTRFGSFFRSHRLARIVLHHVRY